MFKPLSNRVFIEPLEEGKTTSSGIVLPDSDKKSNKGKVVAVGPGRINDKGERIAMSVKVGDLVLYREYGTEVKENGKKYDIRDEDDILAIIE